jgi:hypothetical protein
VGSTAVAVAVAVAVNDQDHVHDHEGAPGRRTLSGSLLGPR